MIDKEVERLRRRAAKAELALEAGRKEHQHQLEIATRVHRSLLPESIQNERILVDVRYIPIEAVGGDYCQVRFSDPRTCYITISDVTGHGIGPALLATRVSSEVRHLIMKGRAPRDLVLSLNRFICDHFGGSNLYVSFMAARIDLERREITWSGAGHPSPLLIRRQGSAVERLDSQNLLLGVATDVLDDEPESTISFKPTDRLLFYTDGLTESTNEAGSLLGVDRLAEITSVTMSADLFDMADQILNQVNSEGYRVRRDDLTLIVAEVK